MGQNYQQKYQQLKLVCRRHEATIARLQLEIRERCQSYLLHSSKHRKTDFGKVDHLPQPLPQPQLSLPSQQSEKTKSLKSLEESETEKECYFEVEVKKDLAISLQVQLTVCEQQQKPVFAVEDRAALIDSFKERISILQGNKNELVRQLQKQGKINYDLDIKVRSLQRELEAARKGEKKAREKLKKLPQYQEKLDQIYAKLIYEAREEEKEIDGDKQVHEKLNEIIVWIQRAKMSLEKTREEFNLNLTDAKTDQKIPIQNNEKIITSEFSPIKDSQKKNEVGWTIISKLNQIDIVPELPSAAKEQAQLDGSEYQSEIQMLQEHNSMFEEELRQSKVELFDVREEAIRSRAKITSLKQFLEASRVQRQKMEVYLKDKLDALQKQLLTSQTENQEKESKLQLALIQLDSVRNQLSKEKQAKRYQQQISISRIKGSELQQSKLITQIDSLKQSLQRTNLNQSINSCEGNRVDQIELEQPYYVEEDLKIDGQNEYVKRSFIRKKIVRRNLSATAYRIVSKSREEVDEIVSNKLADFRDKSKEKASRRKEEEKKQKIKAKQEIIGNNLQRVSEVSEPRDSGINTECDVVKVIEVTTRSGNEQVRTAKVYEKGYQSQLSTKRRF